MDTGRGDVQDTFGSPVRRIKAVMEPVVRMIVPARPRNAAMRCAAIRSAPEVNFVTMKSEAERLKTYFMSPAWNVKHVSPSELAKAGLFSMRSSDKVQCAFCKGVIGEWEEGDVPMKEHKRHYPRCPFVNKLPVGNIPPAESKSEAPNPSAASLGIEKCKGPKDKTMVSVSSRLKSFKEKNWPASTGITEEVMSAAGFYYAGVEDHVKCFYCGGGLKNWVPSDNPLEVHAKWFPNCVFVNLNKTRPNVSVACPRTSPQGIGCPPDASQVPPTTESLTQNKPQTGKDLIEELKRLREERRCKVCKDKDATIVHLPCGHLASCPDCAKICKNCTICQQPIKATVRTYS
ncbi:unnamed protein product [Allacma fusca]|uniref:RING-type domain-containing protein n=1 Tax=Allacma fusca TaxID=39272 RepID=A0A8J2NPV8_9HEXA|nr:unnamed protein product [Allacma fusca]